MQGTAHGRTAGETRRSAAGVSSSSAGSCADPTSTQRTAPASTQLCAARATAVAAPRQLRLGGAAALARRLGALRTGVRRARPAVPAGAVEYYEAVGDGQLAVLGGGLNNMLMGFAQLLTDLCPRERAVLLLPPLDADRCAAPATTSCVHARTSRTPRAGAVGEWHNRPRPPP